MARAADHALPDTIAVPGAKLAARRAGAGDLVLFVHGSASDDRTWDGPFAAAARGHRAVVYSRRFHRPNPRLHRGEPYLFAQQLDDLLAVIDAEGGPMTLVGHSYGGVLALLAAGRRPEAVRRLVLVEPAVITRVLGDPPQLGEIARLAASDPVLAGSLIRFAVTGLFPARAAARRGDRDRAGRLFGRGVLGREAFARLSPQRARQVEENFFLAELFAGAPPRITEAEVKAVRCPTLVVAGDSSPAFFRRLAARLARELPDARLITIPGAAHIVHEDAPDAFNAALIDFLGREEPA